PGSRQQRAGVLRAPWLTVPDRTARPLPLSWRAGYVPDGVHGVATRPLECSLAAAWSRDELAGAVRAHRLEMPCALDTERALEATDESRSAGGKRRIASFALALHVQHLASLPPGTAFRHRMDGAA